MGVRNICQTFFRKSGLIFSVFTIIFSQILGAISVSALAPASPAAHAVIEFGGSPTAITSASGDSSEVAISYPHGTITASGTGLYSDPTYRIYALGSLTLTATPSTGYTADLKEDGTSVGTTKTYSGLISGAVYHLEGEFTLAADSSDSTKAKKSSEGTSTTGTFRWSYREEDQETEDYIAHGHLELVKVVYKGTEYTEDTLDEDYLQWQESDGEGNALLPAGSEVTIKLIPDTGYQLAPFATESNIVYKAGEEANTYTFTVPSGALHLGIQFTAVSDTVEIASTAVESASISIDSSELSSGTARLDVTDAKLTADDVIGFESAANGYSVSTYLDISLYQVTHKATSAGTWDSQIHSLASSASITLQLEDVVDGNEVAVVHQKHDGAYELLPAVYDESTRTVTFETSSFSNYAIASRLVTLPEIGSFTPEDNPLATILPGISMALAISSLLVLMVKKQYFTKSV